MNLSLGWPGDFFTTDKSYWLNYYGLGDEFFALSELGVVCVASAGNDYVGLPYDYFLNYGSGIEDYDIIPAGTHSVQGILAPAAYPEVISVGATWGGPDLHDWGSFNANIGEPNAGSIVHFSQRDDDLLDVVAYGGGITSAALGGGSTAASGTSMASPYVTGLVLLMQEAAEQELGRKLSVDEIRSIINNNDHFACFVCLHFQAPTARCPHAAPTTHEFGEPCNMLRGHATKTPSARATQQDVVRHAEAHLGCTKRQPPTAAAYNDKTSIS